MDAYTRECLALEVDTSFASRRVRRVLEAIVAERGQPQAIRCDNGPELTSRHFLAWCVERQIELVHIQPGKPTQNARVESFNGRLRDECLSVSWFQNLFDARRKIAAWRKEYNEDRPHSSLRYKTPKEFAAQAASFYTSGAISRYLLLRAPEEVRDALLNAPTLADALDEIADPALGKIVNEAVWYCWEQGRPNYSPTVERREFMRYYIAVRIPTVRLLDEAWVTCQAEERDAIRARVLSQFSGDRQTGVPDLEGLDDGEVDHLYHSTLRRIAADSHRGRSL